MSDLVRLRQNGSLKARQGLDASVMSLGGFALVLGQLQLLASPQEAISLGLLWLVIGITGLFGGIWDFVRSCRRPRLRMLPT